MCILLAIDYGQIIYNYSCNNWVCNNQGQCNFNVDPNGNVNQTCACNSGWTGSSCIFPLQDYSYGLSLFRGIFTYTQVLTQNNTVPITNETTYLAILQMTQTA